MQFTFRYIVPGILLFCTSISGAQDISLSGSGNHNDIFESRLSGEIYSPPERFANSQNYFDDWKNGDVRLISGEVVRNQKIQYNAYMDEVFWLHPSIYREVRLDKHLIESFTIGDHQPGNDIIFRRIFTRDNASGRNEFFARVLYEGNFSLFSQRVFRESGRTRSATVGNNIVSRIVLISDHKYFIKTGDGNFIPVRSSKRSLYQAFPEKRDALRSYLRSNRKRIRNEADLIEAVAFLGSVKTSKIN